MDKLSHCPVDWSEVKAEFYKDAQDLGLEILKIIKNDDIVIPEDNINANRHRPFYALETTLKSTMMEAYGKAALTGTDTCPYADILKEKLTRKKVAKNTNITDDRRVFLESAIPGGYEAPVLIANLIGRMKDASAVHGVDANPYELAKNSIGLIRQPLRHPQQWAKAFMFTLVDTDMILMNGKDVFTFRREDFLPNEILAEYTKISMSAFGPQLQWSIPIEDFTLKAPSIVIHSRTSGTETDPNSSGTRVYEQGTRLGDISVDEKTLTCPGKPLANFLWKKGVELAQENKLWDITLKA